MEKKKQRYKAERIGCNHCEEEIVWYESPGPDEWILIDNKRYCLCCFKRIAHKGIDL